MKYENLHRCRFSPAVASRRPSGLQLFDLSQCRHSGVCLTTRLISYTRGPCARRQPGPTTTRRRSGSARWPAARCFKDLSTEQRSAVSPRTSMPTARTGTTGNRNAGRDHSERRQAPDCRRPRKEGVRAAQACCGPREVRRCQHQPGRNRYASGRSRPDHIPDLRNTRHHRRQRRCQQAGTRSEHGESAGHQEGASNGPHCGSAPGKQPRNDRQAAAGERSFTDEQDPLLGRESVGCPNQPQREALQPCRHRQPCSLPQRPVALRD